jgi:hypothetical protein
MITTRPPVLRAGYNFRATPVARLFPHVFVIVMARHGAEIDVIHDGLG